MRKFNIYRFDNLKRLNRTIFCFFLLLISIKISSCLPAGTHGSINAYTFPVSKYILQKAVNNVIAKEPNIYVPPITDTFNSKYYNDGERYVTIKIKAKEELNEYTFQYTGEKEYWDTAKSSEISIAYAFDKNNKGGSEGDGNFPLGLKKKLLTVFENEFMNKIDSVLKQKKY